MIKDGPSKVGDEINGLRVYAEINLSLFGLWVMFMYWYFSVDRSKLWWNRRKQNGNTNAAVGASETSSAVQHIVNGRGDDDLNKKHQQESHDDEKDDPCLHVRMTPVSTRMESSKRQALPTPLKYEQQDQQQRRAYSFNIFDGTNAAGAFAEYIYEGNSEDELEGRAENAYWSDVQDQI